MIEQLLGLGIDLGGKTSGQSKSLCPICSSGRTNKNDPCLSVNIDTGGYTCHHCGFSGYAGSNQGGLPLAPEHSLLKTIRAEINYPPPQDLPESVYNYLVDIRSIPENILIQMKIGFADGRILFPFIKNGEVVNIKRLDFSDNPQAKWFQKKDGEQCFYSYDNLDNEQTIITEGEIDALSVMAAGLGNVVSVPAGAPNVGAKNLEKKFSFLENDKYRIQEVKEFIIAVDNDENGRFLTQELISRLGAQRCLVVEWPDGCKDANDVLVKQGPEVLKRCIQNARKPLGLEIPTPETSSLNKEEDEKLSGAIKEQLIKIADGFEFFHDPDGEAYVTFQNKKGHETRTIKSAQFKVFLVGSLYKAYKKVPNDQTLNDVMRLLSARAIYDGEEHKVFIRSGFSLEGNIYLDLYNHESEYVEITKEGWNIVLDPPVKFLRTPSMREMVKPEGEGNISALKEFLNLNHKQFKLFIGFILACHYPHGPYPIICVQGEHGSGKSVLLDTARNLCDPSKGPRRRCPTHVRDLVINAKNSHLLSFDNLSGMKAEIADAFCRLSTGGGFSVRSLYTDDVEFVFEHQCPIILNGIENVAGREDTRDRTILLKLSAIDENDRREEADMEVGFKKAQPAILAGIMDGLVSILANLDSVELEKLPRMADFAKRISAAEVGGALPWEKGAFMEAYWENINATIQIGLDNDLVAPVLLEHLEDDAYWSGSTSDLLKCLNDLASEELRRLKYWPKAANSLSAKLTRLAPGLRTAGYGFDKDEDSNSRVKIISFYPTEVL